ncbi:Fpg/Nei family DNA glycosylase [Auraticoccus sp. F435]|uniref:Fpg/Nei family DNA glycosylase n=1 Tax=Auraticoccus cholistanensis TaxID=2656650 RepID=A0A6A9UPJ7_9ACTN|nr:DNA-formamidopyrimidine glycosylase family protein [Auraticoccus cholistanensis]MVA74806.1 Fpg/Nei family DNA glycosylase [Auraticoccus cholistanensis]
MPEMPEVESLREFLEGRCVGRVVARAELAAFSALKTFDPPLSALHGLEVTAVRRFGKFLALDADGVWLVVHLARAGWLRWREQIPPTPARPGKGPLALRVVLDDDSGFDLTEAGTQRKLAVYVVTSPDQVPGIATLGPDPTSEEFGRPQLDEILTAAGRAQLKGVLRDQRVLAGIGNAYSDEILHAARMSPFKAASSLDDAERDTLLAAIKGELAEAIERSRGRPAAELKDQKRAGMAVHGRAGQPCPVCGDTVAEVSFADSSLQYCPTCQTAGKKLADRRMSRLLK